MGKSRGIRNPFSVTYDDLIESTEKRIQRMQAKYPGMVLTGQIKDHHAKHNLEIEKVKLKLFMKFKKEPQLDLFNALQKMK